MVYAVLLIFVGFLGEGHQPTVGRSTRAILFSISVAAYSETLEIRSALDLSAFCTEIQMRCLKKCASRLS